MSIATTNKSIFVLPLFVLIMVFTAVSTTFVNASEQQTANRITVRGQVDINYIIPEQDVLIPVKDKRWRYTSLDLESVNRDKVQIHTGPAAKMRLAFREGLPKHRRLGPANWYGEVFLDKEGRFEIEIDLDKKLPAVYRNKQDSHGSETAESDAEVKSVYMVLRSGVHSEKFGHEGYRVLGFHELDLEEDKKTYNVDISFPALLPRKFSGVVQNIADREDINASVDFTAKFNGQKFSSGRAKCEDDGSFEMTILPLDGAEIECEVRGLDHVVFETESMSTDYMPLRKIMNHELIIEVQERPPPLVIFEVEIVDNEGKPATFEKKIERATFYIGFMKNGHNPQWDNYKWQNVELWVAAGSDKVHLWDVPLGKKTLVARHMMKPQKITPKTVEIKDLDEEDRPQVINVQIVHEP